MKTMLIPVDLTKTTDHAIEYGVRWAKQYGYRHIVLLKTFYSSVFASIVPPTEYEQIEEHYFPAHRREDMKLLYEKKKALTSAPGMDIKVTLAVSELPLLRSVMQILESEEVELVVLGSDHFTAPANSFISAHSIEIAKVSTTRVLIVPSVSGYEPIRKVLVPVDYNALASLSRLKGYETISATWKEKELLVLNVDPEGRHLLKDELFENAEAGLHDYLRDFRHTVYYSGAKSIVPGIIGFLAEHPVELIVALPGRHSFLYSLTHKSISEALYKSTPKPVLILK